MGAAPNGAGFIRSHHGERSGNGWEHNFHCEYKCSWFYSFFLICSQKKTLWERVLTLELAWLLAVHTFPLFPPFAREVCAFCQRGGSACESLLAELFDQLASGRLAVSQSQPHADPQQSLATRTPTQISAPVAEAVVEAPRYVHTAVTVTLE